MSQEEFTPRSNATLRRIELTLKIIRLLRELQLTEFSTGAASSLTLAPTDATVAAATSSALIDFDTSSAPRLFVRNLEIRPTPTVELVPRTVLLEGEEVQEAT